MISNTAGERIALSETQELTRKTGNIVARKIWLPKLLYDALPVFYVVSGVLAFFATLYISEWFWVLPHYALFSLACLHMGVLVYRRRRAAKAENSVTDLS